MTVILERLVLFTLGLRHATHLQSPLVLPGVKGTVLISGPGFDYGLHAHSGSAISYE